MLENRIGTAIVEAATKIHRELGPGLFEIVYEVTLDHELTKAGFKVKRQVPVSIVYDGIKFEEGFRADLIVNDKVIIELKAIENVMNVHKKQLLTYLKLSGLKLGYLLNFNTDLMKNGITRSVNGLTER